MTFGSINRSEIEIKPSAQGDFLKSIKKETKNKPKFLKTFRPRRFLENDHKRTMMAKSW